MTLTAPKLKVYQVEISLKIYWYVNSSFVDGLLVLGNIKHFLGAPGYQLPY